MGNQCHQQQFLSELRTRVQSYFIDLNHDMTLKPNRTVSRMFLQQTAKKYPQLVVRSSI